MGSASSMPRCTKCIYLLRTLTTHSYTFKQIKHVICQKVDKKYFMIHYKLNSTNLAYMLAYEIFLNETFNEPSMCTNLAIEQFTGCSHNLMFYSSTPELNPKVDAKKGSAYSSYSPSHITCSRFPRL